MLELFIETIATVAGEVVLVTDAEGRLRAVDFPDYEERMLRLLRRHYGKGGYSLTPATGPSAAARTLQAYFTGDLAAIDRIETATGGTEFQRTVWAALRDIPAGQTTSYGRLAARLGMPRASRAVGLANGANPIAIVVPCHRLVGADGSLTGYAGGMARKRWLLDHEAAKGA